MDAILDVLRADGGRITVGRRAIVHALLTAPDHHVTADDVAAMVQAEHPDVHLSTIYRTLEALERHGVVDRVGLGPAVPCTTSPTTSTTTSCVRCAAA